MRYVKPAYDNFVGPTSRHADIVSASRILEGYSKAKGSLQIVPGSDNSVAIELISTHIRRQLNDRAQQFRQEMAHTPAIERLSFFEDDSDIPGVILLPQTPQLKVSGILSTRNDHLIISAPFQGIYTLLRDATTKRQDFIFFVDRLATFLMEKAMEQLPYRTKNVETPVGETSAGKVLDTEVS